MDKKKLLKELSADDLKGFEEFVDSQPGDTSFLPRPPGVSSKKETSFEHFTFLQNDSIRLEKLKNLLSEKLPFASKYDQGQFIIKEQKEEIQELQKKIFELCDQRESAYRKSLEEIFDPYFRPSN